MESGDLKGPSYTVLEVQRKKGTKVISFLSLVYSVPATGNVL